MRRFEHPRRAASRAAKAGAASLGSKAGPYRLRVAVGLQRAYLLLPAGAGVHAAHLAASARRAHGRAHGRARCQQAVAISCGDLVVEKALSV